MNKIMDTAAIVAELKDGMTLGIGGWGLRRKPMALIREILRSPLKDLTLVSYGGPDVGMLCAAGKVRKLIFGFVSLDIIPLEPYFRKAREKGEIDVSEIDEGLLVLGLRAAAWRLPYLPTRIGLGTDVMTYNPHFRTVTSPYDDREVLLAMPAIALDAALLHVSRADRLGNSLTLGPDPFFDDLLARASARCFLSCEALVDRMVLDPAEARCNLFERALVTGVAHAPAGAHPTSCPGEYGWDAEHTRVYAGSAREEGGWASYFDEYVAKGEQAYLERFGGAEAIRSLSAATT
jgi:glutaconate CoA-transferase, subunit A